MLCPTVLETPMKSHVYTYPVKFHAYEIYSWLVKGTFSFCVQHATLLAQLLAHQQRCLQSTAGEY